MHDAKWVTIQYSPVEQSAYVIWPEMSNYILQLQQNTCRKSKVHVINMSRNVRKTTGYSCGLCRLLCSRLWWQPSPVYWPADRDHERTGSTWSRSGHRWSPYWSPGNLATEDHLRWASWTSPVSSDPYTCASTAPLFYRQYTITVVKNFTV